MKCVCSVGSLAVQAGPVLLDDQSGPESEAATQQAVQVGHPAAGQQLPRVEGGGHSCDQQFTSRASPRPMPVITTTTEPWPWAWHALCCTALLLPGISASFGFPALRKLVPPPPPPPLILHSALHCRLLYSYNCTVNSVLRYLRFYANSRRAALILCAGWLGFGLVVYGFLPPTDTAAGNVQHGNTRLQHR